MPQAVPGQERRGSESKDSGLVWVSSSVTESLLQTQRLCQEWLEAPGTGVKWQLQQGNVLYGLETMATSPLPSTAHQVPKPLLEVFTGPQPHPAREAERQECCSAQLAGQGRLFILSCWEHVRQSEDLAAISPWIQGLEEVSLIRAG